MSILFEHPSILITNEKDFSVIKDGYFGVDGSVIDYIGTEKPAKVYDEVRDFTGKLLMPGLINCHNHAAMTLTRGLGNDLPLQEWLFDNMMPLENKFGPREIRAGSELALLEMIASGTTSFSDMYFNEEEMIEACLKAGLKANIARPVQTFDPNEKYEDSIRGKEAVELYEKFHGAGDGRIRIDFSIHAEYTCRDEFALKHSRACKERGLNMHIHLSETKKEHEECVQKYGKTPAKWFYDLGTFENPTFCAHSVWVTDEDIELLAKSGASVVLNPSSNMKLGSGFAPVRKFLDAGVNVCLGTDGAGSNNNLNMFEELHVASIIYKGFNHDAAYLTANDTLRMATINGAKLQGRPDTGCIKVGNKADIIAINLEAPHLIPNPDIPGSLCYTAQGSDVCMNMVDGRILYENGEYLTIDKDRVIANVKRIYTELTK